MMVITSNPSPRERALAMLLELCRVQNVGELIVSDLAIVRDVCALIDELERETVDAKARAASPTAASTATSSTATSASCSIPSAASPLNSSGFQSRLKQPNPVRFASPRAPSSSVNSAQAPSVRENQQLPPPVTLPTTSKKNALRLPSADTRILVPKNGKPVPVKRTAPTQVHAKATPQCESKLRRPAIVVPRVAKTNNSMSVAASKIVPLEECVTQCILAQAAAEHEVSKAVQQLGDAIQWRVGCENGQLYAVVNNERLNGEDLKNALLELRDLVFNSVASAHECLRRVSSVWIDSTWLRFRQNNVEEDALQMYHWIADMAMTIDDFFGSESTVQASTTLVWSSNIRELDATAIDARAMRAQHAISSPAKCDVVLAEHAVGSFIAQTLGWSAASMTKIERDSEDQYDAMVKLSGMSFSLTALNERCNKAATWCGNETTTGLKTWEAKLENEVMFAAEAIERVLVVCSKTICNVEDRQEIATEDQLAIVSDDKRFPGEDRFTLDFYIQTQLCITDLHVAMTRTNELQSEAAAAKVAYGLMANVNEILDDLAAWADPRFVAETDSRPSEKAAYLDLIFWCQQLLEEISDQCFYMSESVSMRCYEECDDEFEEEKEEEYE